MGSDGTVLVASCMIPFSVTFLGAIVGVLVVSDKPYFSQGVSEDKGVAA